MPPHGSHSCTGKFLLGLLLGLILVPAAALLYLRYGTLPVATADKPFPLEKQLVSVPLDARIAREAPKDAPFASSEDVFEGGATLYRRHCAACHGTPGHSVAFARTMYPHSPQLWVSHGNGVTGVSDDPAGETYWKVANGIRLTGMPAFGTVLTPAEMWQISILLKNADQPLPDPVTKILTAKQ